MKLFRQKSGKVFEDGFSTIDPGWDFSPVASVNNTERSGYLRLNHNANGLTLALRLLETDDCFIEAQIDYTPVADDDMGGIVVWNSSANRVELLEKYDSEVSGSYTYLRAIKYDNNIWKLYSLKDNVWEFIDSISLTASMVGIILKGVSSPTFVPLDVNNFVICNGDKLQVSNILPDYSVKLYDGSSTLIETKTVIEDTTGVEFNLPTVPYNGKIEVYDDSDTLLDSVSTNFYAGDIYQLGTFLQILKDDVELSLVDFTNLGTMYNGFLEIQLTVKNPSLTITATNIIISVIQYDSKFGFQWVDIANDLDGVPHTYGDLISISSIGPEETVPMWLRITQGQNYEDMQPLYFVLNVNND